MYKCLKLLFFLIAFLGGCRLNVIVAQDGPELIELTQSSIPEQLPILFYKISCLENVGSEEIKTLISFLSDERRTIPNVLISADIRVSRYAADSLARIGERSVPQLSILVNKTSCADLKFIALRTIGRIAVASKETQQMIQSIIKAEPHSDQNVLAVAVFALGKTAKDPKEAIDIILDLPADSEYFVRAEIANALSELGTGSELAIQKLIALTHDNGANVARNAIAALGEIGAGNEAAKKRLQTLAKDQDFKFVRDGAKAALEKIAQKEVELKDNER